MLKQHKANCTTISCISTTDKDIEELLTKEWLLTNGRGDYSSSTIIGCNTKGYHGLLIGSLNPPTKRIMALSACLEMVIFKGRSPSGGSSIPSQDANSGKIYNLSTFEFDGKFTPQGFTHLKRFYQDTGVHFDYQLDKIEITKSVYLLRDTDTVALTYDFTNVKEPVDFVLRPFVGLRDFHTLQKSYAPLCSSRIDDGLLVRHDLPGSCELFLSCPASNFEKDEQWWFNFVYRNDKERGQDFTEDLWTPGFFKCSVESPKKVVFWANLSNRYKPEYSMNGNIGKVCEDLYKHQNNIVTACKMNKDKNHKILCLAASQFISKRQTNHIPRSTILAGFPWFADWGRDIFIALPGLLLVTGRFEEAKSVLRTFAAAADEGMIPNRFDDRNNTAYFNSVDASLWFINAAFQYLNATSDTKTFMQELMPTIRWIIDSYQKGTRFGIRSCSDGLITAGNHETQLTWMDAKYDGVAYTPRGGKAVEINALWYNSLCQLAQFYAGRDIDNANRYKSMAEQAANSFCELFWNEKAGYLNDCISPDGSVDSSLRPNQIFAVSLPFSPLSAEQQRAVVEAVHKHLLTPYGLRTLNTQDSRYKGTYTGPQSQRDEAYHQGTVWPFLIGPFIEAFLKVNEFSKKSKKQAAEFIRPLLEHLTEDACVSSVSEIFDGNPPHKPKGCIAQAWSVAEVLRAYHLINS